MLQELMTRGSQESFTETSIAISPRRKVSNMSNDYFPQKAQSHEQVESVSVIEKEDRGYPVFLLTATA